MAPGLRGQAGVPCKSGDITGWGLMLYTNVNTIYIYTVLCVFIKATAAMIKAISVQHSSMLQQFAQKNI